jgi:uncharacterized protein YutD
LDVLDEIAYLFGDAATSRIRILPKFKKDDNEKFTSIERLLWLQ